MISIILLLLAALGEAKNSGRALHDCCVQRAQQIKKNRWLMDNAAQVYYANYKKATPEDFLSQDNVTLRFFPLGEMGYSDCPLLLEHEVLPKNATLWFTCRESMSMIVMVFWCVSLVIFFMTLWSIISFCKRCCDRRSKQIRRTKVSSQKLLPGIEEGKNTEFIEEIVDTNSAASTLKPTQKFEGQEPLKFEENADSEDENTIYDYGSLEDECSIHMPIGPVRFKKTPPPTAEVPHAIRQGTVYCEDDELYEDYAEKASDSKEEELMESASGSKDDMERASVDIFQSSRGSISSMKDHEDADETPMHQDRLAPEAIPGPSSRFV